MPRDTPSQLGELTLLALALRAIARSDCALLLARSVTRATKSAKDLDLFGFRGRLFDALGRAESGEDKVASGCFAARVSRLSCSLDSPSGRVLEISTNQQSIQSYDGKYLDASAISGMGSPYGPRAGLCLEPQNFPDTPNHSNFPESRLDPGEVYFNRVVYKFASS
jgi:hypothetical protein